MPTWTTWYVTVVLEIAGKERQIHGPGHSEQAPAEADLNALRELLGTGTWINLSWISANPKNVVAAYLDSSSVGIA
jgi:hypothetical protein